MSMKSTPTDELRALRVASGASPNYSKIVQPQAAGRFTRVNLGGIEPPRLVSIMREAQSGDMEDWADLCSYAVRSDPHLRSLVGTRSNAVAGAEIEILPGPHGAGQEAAAEAAAAFVRDAFDRIEEWEDRFADLLWGTFFNVAALENRWRVEGSTVWGDFGPIQSRDLRYARDWGLLARTYVRDANGQPTGSEQWVRLSDHPGKFTINAPRNISERPTMTGELFAVMWPWLFKRIVEKFGLEGFGKLSNGLMYSTLGPNAEQNVMNDRLDAMESLGADGVAVFKVGLGEGPPITLLEASKDPGATAKTLMDHYNGEMSKALLGSGLNVEVSSGGGNRALGESQFATTILPRLEADAKRALGAIRRDFIRPLLGFNLHKFGGQMPPVPFIRAKVVGDEVQPIPQALIDAGVVTVDQLLMSAGLDPRGPDKGGDRIVTPIAKAPLPQFSTAPVTEPDRETASGGAPPPPFQRTPDRLTRPEQLPLTFTPTPSASRRTPLGMALSKASDDPER